MTDNFAGFAELVAADFQALGKSAHVFAVNIEPDVLYAKYLAAFPEGSNPRFKERTEHDCTCCRQFVRRVGNVIAVDAHGVMLTIWDQAAKTAPAPYNLVAAELRGAVLSADIVDLFRVARDETSFGAAETHSSDVVSGAALTWHHFYTGAIPANLRVFSPAADRGSHRQFVQTFARGLDELTPDAVTTVLGLIEANTLYRGDEHKAAVARFQKTQEEFHRKTMLDALTDADRTHVRAVFLWTTASEAAAKFRDSAIGTLVQDLSKGVDLERAVKSFESKVAPTNYKRTTALITPGMVKKAMETIAELDIEPALERRFATIADVSVRDVKWVDGAAKLHMKGGIGDALMQHAAAASPKSTEDDEKRAEEISLDDFMGRILPETTGMELLFKGAHLGNLVSLTAPVHPEPRQLFKWTGNDFAWSYTGNVADSIAERVKKQGGKVEGALLRVSLSWYNFDDLDLHVLQPAGRGTASLYDRIYFGNKRGWTGGELDVDMNAGGPRSREAVENIVWMQKMPDGAYKVIVNNYNQRESSDPGFVIEVESAGKISHYSYNKTVRNQQDIAVVTLHMKNGVITRIDGEDPGITESNVSQDKWVLTTEQYVKVNAVTLSPNYWGDNKTGNKHTIFLLDGCKSDEPTRGIYNEFLHPRLEPHRKVFEIIGEKTKCAPTDGQLSGVGFSSTKKDAFIVKVRQGKKQRLFNVKVGGA